MSIEISEFWIAFIAYLLTSYSLGVFALRKEWSDDSPPIAGFFFLLSPLWVPFYGLGRLVMLGRKKKKNW